MHHGCSSEDTLYTDAQQNHSSRLPNAQTVRDRPSRETVCDMWSESKLKLMTDVVGVRSSRARPASLLCLGPGPYHNRYAILTSPQLYHVILLRSFGLSISGCSLSIERAIRQTSLSVTQLHHCFENKATSFAPSFLIYYTSSCTFCCSFTELSRGWKVAESIAFHRSGSTTKDQVDTCNQWARSGWGLQLTYSTSDQSPPREPELSFTPCREVLQQSDRNLAPLFEPVTCLSEM
ncbi:hypothetical protein J6590_057932 [Homalodisca vitripennis]|nr:hypothetical protein J6590_057932 [Homalodisca vitripennis]